MHCPSWRDDCHTTASALPFFYMQINLIWRWKEIWTKMYRFKFFFSHTDILLSYQKRQSDITRQDIFKSNWYISWLTRLNQWEKEKREEIWHSPITKAPTPTEKSKKATRQHKNATKNFDYTTIADRLRTVSFGNDKHPTGVVKPVYGIPTFPVLCMTTSVQHPQHTAYFL